MERFIAIYSKTIDQAFTAYDLQLNLKMWGGKLPYSCKTKPSFTMHMEDARNRVRWLRAFFVWNHVKWEESIIYDLVRIIKEYKEFFDLKKGPVTKEPKEIKYLLQDIVIIFRTLENACHPEFVDHAKPIINELMKSFMAGLHDPKQIQDLYLKVFQNALLYGYEQALEEPFKKIGMDIRQIESWPMKTINQVPEELKDKLIPPIQDLFKKFKTNLTKNKKLSP